jgi:hypothetical protein
MASAKREKIKKDAQVTVHMDVITMENVKQRMEKTKIVAQQTVNHLVEVVEKIIAHQCGLLH